jgi:iron(II)-dependent oxidoreductase
MRTLERNELQSALRQARQYTRALVDDLDDGQWRVPRLASVNPVLWEVGHVGWFMEHWCLRWRGAGREPGAPMLVHADRWYDSARVAHDTRWDLDLPSRTDTLKYLDNVLDATLERLEHANDPASLYFFQLALYHEDMHGEAFAYTRQTCSYPAPPVARTTPRKSRDDVGLVGATFERGVPRDSGGFVFDNEKWGHPATVEPLTLSRSTVTEREYCAFVDDRGYDRPELWTTAGRAWLADTGATGPRYWRRTDGQWEARRFDRWSPITGDAPMTHVTRHEAEAWCRWAQRRLPTETEWEYAALAGAIEADGVWEWTASAFEPYPGFAPDPYAEYSAPWFGTHASVRGGSTATPQRLLHPKFRNFYMPERDDIFVGFRSCALA